MGNSKFTPGPWYLSFNDDNNERIIRTRNEEVICNFECDRQDGDSITPEEGEENARLIVSAPEMYEAMKEFCDRVEKGEVKSTYTYQKFKEILSRVEGGGNG